MEPGEMVDQIAARALARSPAKPPEALDPAKIVADIQARISSRPPRAKAKVYTLPIWPESARGTPNAFLRGALFAAIQGKHRRALKGELLASQGGTTVRFTGWQLGQSDLDVWEQAVQLARLHPMGNVCHFHINAFLRGLGLNQGNSDHASLRDVFRRLGGGLVEITHDRRTYAGTLLEFWYDEDADLFALRLNPTLLDLYQAGWTGVEVGVRRQLRRKPLALWLHGWLSSNAQNYPTKVETIRALSGSANPHKGSFKRQVQTALSDLVTVGFLDGYSVDGDLVSVTRTPSPTQARHLARKRKGPVDK